MNARRDRTTTSPAERIYIAVCLLGAVALLVFAVVWVGWLA
ncbi:hypothetical protein [Actinophytocola sediminis]